MEKPLDSVHFSEKFSEVENILGEEPDEDRCQEALLGLEQLAEDIKEKGDVIIAAKFQSQWRELSSRIKERADCKTYLDSKREIERNINLILDPDFA